MNLVKKNFFGLKINQLAIAVSCALLLTNCASTSEHKVDYLETGDKFQIKPSYLKSDKLSDGIVEQTTQTDEESEMSGELGVEKLSPLSREKVSVSSEGLNRHFSDSKELSVTVNDMTMKSFLNYVFGDLLSIDYVIGKNVENSKITLNVASKISPRKLFEMTTQVLQEQRVGIRLNDGIYYIYQLPQGGKVSVAMGFGRDSQSVPQNSGQVLQVVPLKYGVRISVERTLNGLVDAKITPDFEQSALFIQGTRDQIIRALDLIRLLDVPSNRGKYISLISPVFISVDDFVSSTTELLKTEGIEIPKPGSNNGNLLFVPLSQLGSVAVFSAEQELLNRVEYWAAQIDKPSKGTERQYHIYTPKFARASDLGDSISPLISGESYSGNSKKTSSKDNKDSSVVDNNSSMSTLTSNDKMTLVVDARSNSLIFHASGTEYQSILPLVQRMDILPKQVLLSVTIAEVKLTGEFKRGFEFALSSGNFSGSTKGGLGLDEIVGGTFSWKSGANEIIGKFVEENSQVNILSKPSLLVRDGTEANINVGDKIPVSSGSSSSGSGEVVTENITYRETGIKLTVTPTVNAQGVVIMEINQEISNQVVGPVGKGGNPTFFDRSIKTEVVADTGQTILLGGLISDDTTNSNKGVPYLKSIPLIGALFESDSKNNTKTELVIMVTPKIVERSSQWNGILNQFQKALTNIDIE
ncbi:Type II secretory pathway component PulD-like protein [Shewanella sediminis HAW-EB3]|uniref:Type II secretory pathway component PulD-like protein n=1 Tax=Shewanella sediminis (strain HAW-EB3) TaxID=425104 RepID=A8FXQ1_SHESH|nr:Type II secretory pathway component PulD-like protein [Shewanella sediminis]ABV37624.1 Type II secretory pathway component PulD-like protein [Shewanella sediminis HAW-EB3]